MDQPQIGALDGIRVLDMTTVVMGPLATRSLGDLGADVITIETKHGDLNRRMGPGPDRDFSGTSLNLMRNKRSIALDLKDERGRSACLAIATTCDVVVTNLRPGPLGRLGLDYDAIREVRPDIVFCAAHGYPSDGPKADAPAYDDIIQSASGVSDLYQRVGGEPNLLPTLVADKVSGMAIANAVLAALYYRSRTGHGQRIEVPMIDVMTSFILTEHGGGAIPEPPTGEPGHTRILTPTRRPQPTADGWISLLPYNKDHYDAVFAAGGRADLVGDARYRTTRERMANSGALYGDVAAILPQRTTEEWLDFCTEHGIPATRATTLDELIEGLPLEEHPTAGSYRLIPPAERFSETPARLHRHAPRVGEHSREVLREIGFDATELDALEDAGVLGRPTADKG